MLLTFNDGVSTAIDSKFNEPVLLEILQKLHNTLLNDVLHFNKPFLLLKERTANCKNNQRTGNLLNDEDFSLI